MYLNHNEGILFPIKTIFYFQSHPWMRLEIKYYQVFNTKIYLNEVITQIKEGHTYV